MKQTRQELVNGETRRSFDEEFKRHAIQLIEGGRAVAKVARELDVKPSMLYEWKRKFGQPSQQRVAAPADLGTLQEENRELRAEVDRLRQREHILKKTLGILSEPGSSASNASRR